MERAGFGLRFVAALIDNFLFWVIYLIIAFIMGILFGSIIAESIGILDMVVALVSFIIPFLYWVWYPVRTDGQTIGKKITGIRVQKEDGESVTMGTMFIRELVGKIVSFLILFIGYFMALGKEKRTLHDYLAKTVVVKTK